MAWRTYDYLCPVCDLVFDTLIDYEERDLGQECPRCKTAECKRTFSIPHVSTHRSAAIPDVVKDSHMQFAKKYNNLEKTKEDYSLGSQEAKEVDKELGAMRQSNKNKRGSDRKSKT